MSLNFWGIQDSSERKETKKELWDEIARNMDYHYDYVKILEIKLLEERLLTKRLRKELEKLHEAQNEGSALNG